MADFIVLKQQLNLVEQNKLTSTSALASNGLQPNAPAYASDMNAILHETSLVVTAFAKYMKTIDSSVQISPDADAAEVNNIANAILATIQKTVVDNAAVAAKVAKSLTIDINTTTYAFNGSSDISAGTIYVPTSGGSSGQILISKGNAAPEWSAADLGATDKPIYLSTGIPTACSKYAGGTRVTLNNDPRGASTASFYAPTTNAIAADYAIISNASGAPSWYDNSFYLRTMIDSGYVYRKPRIVMRRRMNSSFVSNLTTDVIKDSSTADSNYPFVFNYVTGTAESGGKFEMHQYASDAIYDITNAPASYFEKQVQFTWGRWLQKQNGSSYSVDGGSMMTLTLIGRTKTNAGRGQLWVDSGGIVTTGQISAPSYVSTSDKRLKKNIVDFMPKASILDLQIKEFDYIQDDSHHIGCIAQDLQKIAPELVHEDDKGYLQIEEMKLVYLLLDEVKKLRKELDELKGTK